MGASPYVEVVVYIYGSRTGRGAWVAYCSVMEDPGNPLPSPPRGALESPSPPFGCSLDSVAF